MNKKIQIFLISFYMSLFVSYAGVRARGWLITASNLICLCVCVCAMCVYVCKYVLACVTMCMDACVFVCVYMCVFNTLTNNHATFFINKCFGRKAQSLLSKTIFSFSSKLKQMAVKGH